MSQQSSSDILKDLEILLFKFALIDGEKSFETFLEQNLTLVLEKLNYADKDEAVKRKVLEVLSNINKRSLVISNVQFPIKRLLELYHASTSNMLLKNFAIVYIEKGFKSLEAKQRAQYLNEVVTGIHRLHVSHQDIFCHILLSILVGVSAAGGYSKSQSEIEKQYPWKSSQPDCNVVLAFFLDLILVPQPQFVKTAEGVLVVPPGHSQSSLQRVMGKTYDKYDYNALFERKMAVLDILQSGVFSDTDVLVHYIVGSVDTFQKVQEKSDEALKRLPKINYENQALIDKLYQLFIGTSTTQTSIPVESRKQPASPVLREKIFQIFCKSLLAANKSTLTLQVIFEGVYGSESSIRLKQSAMAFVQWVFRHASDDQIKLTGHVILSGLMKLLEELESYSGKDINELKAFTYTSLGLLCKRRNDLFSSDLNLIQDLFKKISKEESVISSSIQDALTMIREAFINNTVEIKNQLIDILLSYLNNKDDQIKKVLIKWSQHCYEFDNIKSKYINLVLSGDTNPNTRDEAKKGLEPYAHQGNMLVPGDEYKQKYPDFKLLLEFIQKERKEILTKQKLQKAIGFSGLAYENMILFLRQCLKKTAFHNHLTITKYLNQSLDKEVLESYKEFIMVGLESKLGDDIHMVCVVSLLQLLNAVPSMVSEFVDKVSYFEQLQKSSVKLSLKDLYAKTIALISLHLTSAQLSTNWSASMKKLSESSDVLDIYGNLITNSLIITAFNSRSDKVDSIFKSQPDLIPNFIKLIMNKFIDHNSQSVKVCSVQSLGWIGVYSSLPIDSEEKSKIIGKLLEFVKITGSDRTVPEAAIQSLGYLSFGDDENEQFKSKIIDSFFELIGNKNEELQFTIGDTLALIVGGKSLMVNEIEPFSPFSSEERTVEKNEEKIYNINEDDDNSMKVDKKSEGEINKNVSSIIQKILGNYFSDRQSPTIRCSAGIWMVCLLKHFGKSIQSLLPEIQNGLISLLSDNNELTQEIASKGITLVYESSQSKEFREFLVSNLSKTLSGKPAPKAPGSTELLPEGVLNKNSSQVLTFKELNTVANDLGKPDMIYKLMNLSSHHQIWNSKKGASFAIVSLASQAKEELEPLLPHLIPKIYRFLYDPSPKIAQSMKNILNSLTASSSSSTSSANTNMKDIMTKYFIPIINDNISGLSNNSWRVREASCNAIPDIVANAPTEQLLPFLEQLFYLNFRTLDDIKETVRKAAESSIKSLGSMSTRLCDPTYTSKARAEGMLKVLLPFFLKSGLGNDSNDVKKFAIQQLVKISKTSKDLLIPHVPLMTQLLLESLSSLEPAALNYASFHMESKEQVENLRVELSKALPINDILEQCQKYIDESNVNDVLANLMNLLQFAVGTTTRVGTYKFLTALFQVKNYPIIRDSINEQQMLKLINTLLPSVKESVAISRVNAITALSWILRASSQKIRETVVLEKIMTMSTNENVINDQQVLESTLEIQGQIFKELYRNSCDLQFLNKEIIPFLYFYKTHPKKEISDIYKFIWDDNSIGSIKLYCDEVVELISKMINSGSWATKQQAALCLSSLTEDIKSMIDSHLPVILNLITQGLKGRTYPGKDSLLESLATVCHICTEKIQNGATSYQPKDLALVMFAECKKNDLDYKRKAIPQLTSILKSFQTIDIFSEIKEEFYPTLFPEEGGNDEKMNVDDDDVKLKPLRLLVKNSLWSLMGEAYSAGSKQTQLENQDLFGRLIKQFRSSIWNEQVSILNSLKSILTKSHQNQIQLLDESTLSELFKILNHSLETSKYNVVKKSCLDLIEYLPTILDKSIILQNFKSNLETLSKLEPSLSLQSEKILNLLKSL